jgi:hypothetical protein
MKYLGLASLVALLGVLPGSSAEAGYPCHRGRCVRVVNHVAPDYYGCEYSNWQYFAWSAKYGCRCYFSPRTRAWYYYHSRDQRFYPLERIGEAPPPPLPVPEGEPTTPVPFTRDQLPPPPDAVAPGAPPAPDAVAPGAPPAVPDAGTPDAAPPIPPPGT